MTSPLVIIPARLGSTRLPMKPLAQIHGEPMIAHVLRRALEADVGPVIVAVDDRAVARAVEAAGGCAIMTRADHASGSDRIFEALNAYDPGGRHQIIVNLQGDLPTVPPSDVAATLAPLDDPAVAIATLATEILDEADRANPNVVKAVGTRIRADRLRALYFTRARAPYGDGPLYHHIGIYAYRRESLARFVALSPSPLERRERLEQLRALEAGMRIDIALVATAPLGVDAPEDLEKARAALAPKA